MCLLSKELNPAIATEDIVCYKAVKNITKYFCGRKKYKSPFRGYTWLMGKMETAELGVTNRYTYCYVDEGLHAYVESKYCEKHISCYSLTECDSIVKCIIPKGSEYFLGDDNDIVANKMKIVKEVKF